MTRIRDMARIVHTDTNSRNLDQITDEMRQRVAEATDHRGWPKVDALHVAANAWLVWRSSLRLAESGPHHPMSMLQAASAAPDGVTVDTRLIDRDGDQRGLVAEFAAYQLMADLWPHLPVKTLQRCVTDEDREAFGSRQRISKYLKDTGNMMCMRRGNRGSTSLWWVRQDWTEDRISRVQNRDRVEGGTCPLCRTGRTFSTERTLLRHLETQHGADDARHVLQVARQEQVSIESDDDDHSDEVEYDAAPAPAPDPAPTPHKVLAGQVLSEDTTELAKRLRELADYAEHATSSLEADRRRLAAVVTDLRGTLAERDRTIAELTDERDALTAKLDKLSNVQALFEMMKDEV